jgi:predicted nucleotidyltransferase
MTDPVVQLEEHAAELQQLGAKRIGIFGSVARDEARAGSDVDVYVEFESSKRTFRNFNALYELLESIFGRTVDLVTDASLSARSAGIILPTVRYAALGS